MPLESSLVRLFEESGREMGQAYTPAILRYMLERDIALVKAGASDD
jgi:hypothetical protein